VLASIVVDGLENDVDTAAPVLVYAAAGLVAGLLLWAGFILTGLRRLAEEYPVALIVAKSQDT